MAITKKKATKETKEAKKETKVNFKEVKHTGEVFEYSVRIYPGKDGVGKVKKSWGCQITLNDVITIKGVKLVETESSIFLSYPQYKSDDNWWNSYIYIDKDLNNEMDALTAALCKAVGLDASGDETMDPSEAKTDLPF